MLYIPFIFEKENALLEDNLHRSQTSLLVTFAFLEKKSPLSCAYFIAIQALRGAFP